MFPSVTIFSFSLNFHPFCYLIPVKLTSVLEQLVNLFGPAETPSVNWITMAEMCSVPKIYGHPKNIYSGQTLWLDSHLAWAHMLISVQQIFLRFQEQKKFLVTTFRDMKGILRALPTTLSSERI